MKSTRWQSYQQVADPLPDTILSWPFYGQGLPSLGVNGAPVHEPLPACGPNEMLVRVDALGLCASDGKMVRMGSDYPLFFNHDIATNPARLGHEAALTVVQVGAAWQDRYWQGQRLGIQPNVYTDGQRTIFGVNIPGAMTQYLTLDQRVLAGDMGSYVFPVPSELSYADIALLEPWSCVDVAYRPVRRLTPKPTGIAWINGCTHSSLSYTLDQQLTSSVVLVSNVSQPLARQVRSERTQVIECEVTAVHQLAEDLTAGAGFDDIILLGPRHASEVKLAIDYLAPNGLLNLVTDQPLDGPVRVDIGRLHYQQLAFVGCAPPDISNAYGMQRNRSDLRADGVTLIVGAGGTLGRMHTQRALEMPAGPRAVIATNRGTARLDSLMDSFSGLARANNRELVGISPTAQPNRLKTVVERLTGDRGCDDVVVVAPGPSPIEQALPFLAADGMLVVFAGVPEGTRVALPLDRVALHAAQFTGTSGSTVTDMLATLHRVHSGQLSAARSVAAVGGFYALATGMRAVLDRTYPGKIVIYPQLVDLALTTLAELSERLPGVSCHLGPDKTWSCAAEQGLFEACL
jgi:threonine dehydrogenase-like Zn-dependent dehydrogenase